jgi:hypothetical protein
VKKKERNPRGKKERGKEKQWMEKARGKENIKRLDRAPVQLRCFCMCSIPISFVGK